METPSRALFAPGTRAGDLAFAAADARGVEAVVAQPQGAAEQAQQSLTHLHGALHRLGLGLDHVVSLWVLLTDYTELAAVSRMLAERFEPARFPAVTYLGVAGLDGGCRVRLDAIASAAADRAAFVVPGVPLAPGAPVHGVRAGGLLYLAGVDAGDVTGDDPAGTLGSQTTAVLDRIDAILRHQGVRLADVGRTFMFMTDLSVRAAYGAARRGRYEGVFALDEYPANSGIGVPALGPGVMLRAVAIAGAPKTYVASPRVRRSPGSFSQAVRLGDWLFVAGQDAIDLEHRTEAVGDLVGQTERTLDYLRYVVEAAGGTLADVVKTTVYLIAGQDPGAFADTYTRYLASHAGAAPRPAGLTLDVQRLAPDVLVEIDAVAYLGPR